MFQFHILCMKTSTDLFRARIPLGLKTSHCTATLCNPMRMILQPYRQSVGSCWVRPIVYLYGPTLIECGLICHCRKCDSNELKGSASTSLMKAIIHSNNVGAAWGAAPSVVASHPVGTAGLPGSPAFMPTSSNYPSKSVYNPQQPQGHGGPHHRPPQQPQLPSSLPQPNQQLNNMAMMSGKFRLLVEFNSSPRFCCQFQQVTNGAVVLELDHCVHQLNLRSQTIILYFGGQNLSTKISVNHRRENSDSAPPLDIFWYLFFVHLHVNGNGHRSSILVKQNKQRSKWLLYQSGLAIDLVSTKLWFNRKNLDSY